jgi:hypothetical protein
MGVEKIAFARLDTRFYFNDLMIRFEKKEIPNILAIKFLSALAIWL